MFFKLTSILFVTYMYANEWNVSYLNIDSIILYTLFYLFMNLKKTSMSAFEYMRWINVSLNLVFLIIV